MQRKQLSDNRFITNLMTILAIGVILYIIGLLKFVIGFVIVVLLPGIMVIKAIWPKDRNIPELLILGTTISITLVPSILFILNLVGVPINQVSIYSVAILISLTGYLVLRNKNRNERVF